MQLINVALGGTLVQDLPEHVGHGEHRRVLGSFDGADHVVDVTRAHAGEPVRWGRLAMPQSPTTTRASTELGEGLQVSATSAIDGLVEAIELPDRPASCSVCSGTPRRRVEPGDRGVRSGVQHRRAGRGPARRRDRVLAARAPTAAATGIDGYLYSRRVRRASAIRTIAWGAVAAGVAAPLLRKRISAPPIVTQAVAFAAPVGLCVAVRRSRARMRPPAAFRCGPTWRRTRRRTTTRPSRLRACTSTTRSASIGCSASAICPPSGCSARSRG